MLKTIHNAGKAGSVPAGMTVSAIVSTTITLILSATIAYFLNSEKISWTQAGYCIMCMLFFAAFVSGKCAYGIIKRQKYLIAAMSGVLYWGILLCTTCLFFGGNFDAVPETAGIIMAGSFTQLLLNSHQKRKNRRNQIVKLTKNRYR